MSNERPWELLVRHAAGRLSASETVHLARWSGEESEHAQLFRRVSRLVEISRAVDAAEHTAEAWQRLEQQLAAQASDARVLHVRPPRLMPAAVPPAPRSTRRAPASRRLWFAAMAAMLVIGVALGVWRWRAATSSAALEIATRRGERLELSLPDGTRVVLGPASQLHYVVRNFQRVRHVELKGEAYFTVAHDRAHPFVVHARGSATQAVGTAFGVRAYRGDAVVRVTVAEGRVLLRLENNALGSGALLAPNEAGAIDPDGQITIQRGIDAARELGWTNGEVHFEHVPLADVLRELGRMYGIDIELGDSTRAAVPVTAVFRHQTADEVAHAVADIVDMRLSRDGDGHLSLQPAAPTR